jgi:hypothetical protein
VAGQVVAQRQSVWLQRCPSANITGKCLLLSFLSGTKEFGNTILVVYHQKQQLYVIVKQSDGVELGSLRDAAWRSLTWTELTNS